MDLPLILAVVEWAPLTAKDLIYGGAAVIALLGGYRKWWCWYHQLEELKASYENQLSQQRSDFTAQITLERARGDEFKDLVLEGRYIVKTSVEAVRTVAARPATG